jgi:hypothetical protein
MHWYLAIICHPERKLQHPSAEPVTPNVITRTRAQESSATKSNGEKSNNHSDESTLTRPPSSKGSTASSRTLNEDEQEVEHAIRVPPATPRACVPTRDTSPPSSPLSFSSVTTQPDCKSEAMEIVPATDSEGDNNVMVVDVSRGPTSSSRLFQSIAPIPSKNFYEDAESTRSTSCSGIRSENDEEEGVNELQDDNHMDVDIIPSLAAEPVRQEVCVDINSNL